MSNSGHKKGDSEPPAGPEPPEPLGVPAGVGAGATMKLEIYRITLDFLAKSFKPAIVIVVIVVFGSTLQDVISRMTKADILGWKVFFAQEVTEGLGKAAERAENQNLDAIVARGEKRVRELREALSVARLEIFLGWDGTEYKREENLNKLVVWLVANGIDPGNVEIFVTSDDFAGQRINALEELGP